MIGTVIKSYFLIIVSFSFFLGHAAKSYGDTIWKDKLTSYDGNSITYDSIGNPLSYKGYNYAWKSGRQLSAISGNGLDASYKYNDSGIQLNGVTTKYHLIKDKETYERAI